MSCKHSQAKHPHSLTGWVVRRGRCHAGVREAVQNTRRRNQVPRNPLPLAVFFDCIHCYVRNGQFPGWEIRWQDVTRCDKLMICREELVPEGSYRLTTARKDPLVCGIKIQCNGFPFGHATSSRQLPFADREDTTGLPVEGEMDHI